MRFRAVAAVIRPQSVASGGVASHRAPLKIDDVGLGGAQARDAVLGEGPPLRVLRAIFLWKGRLGRSV
jgi:hypothetical protein